MVRVFLIELIVSLTEHMLKALNKANQDSYVICENILGNDSSHLFGIFDGHGEYGDYCSYFAASEVIKI